MGAIALCLALISVALTSRALSSSSSSPSSSINFRGISPQDENYYKTGIIWCRDGSKSFSSKYLNDDFCDCGDGTDEPGTSACANGKFYCQNKGHTPLWIFSSRVNDGICDCCDGSDEYDGKAKCVNTCSESGKVWRDKLRKKISTFKAGLEVRNRDIERSKLTIQKDKLEVANLKLEEKKLKDVVKKLGAIKEAIEKAEEKEKLAREEEQNARKEEEEEEEETDRQKDEKKNTEQEKIESEGELDLEAKIELKGEQKDTIKNGIDSSEQENTEGLSKEDLGRLVASRWTGENPNLMREESHGQVDDHHVEESIDGNEKFHDENENDDNMENEQEEEDSQGEGVVHVDENSDAKQENSLSEVEGSRAEPSMWTKLKNVLKSFSGFYSLPSLPLDKSEADQIRKEYQQSNTKLSDIRSKISDLEKKLKQDFGKDGEFYSLYDKCFDLEENKYTYKVCPYRHALQMEGHSSTTLGNWDDFKDDYRSMHFTRGAKCWNGPDRSLKVRLRCGLKVELRDVDEPSRCEYVAELLTPAVCLKERLVALQQRLDTQGGIFSHDEL